MTEFHQTRMGVRFYEVDVPRIANALDKIATALEAEAPGKSDTEQELFVWVRRFASLVGEDGLTEASLNAAFAKLHDALKMSELSYDGKVFVREEAPKPLGSVLDPKELSNTSETLRPR